MFNRKLEKRIKELEDAVLTKREVVSCEVCGCLLLSRNLSLQTKVVECYYQEDNYRRIYCSIHKPPYDSVVSSPNGNTSFYKKLEARWVLVNEKGKPIKKAKKC